MEACRWITLDELERRHTEWRTLAAESHFPTAYSDPGWVLAWWRAYGEDNEPWSLALEDADGSLRGLVLLARSRRLLARTLSFAGDPWNGLNTLLCAPGDEAEVTTMLLAQLEARRHDWDVWRVGRLPAESHLARELVGGHGLLHASADDIRLQPFVALPADVPTYESQFGSKHQRRKWRRLLDAGATPRLVQSPEEIESTVLEMLALRHSRASTRGQRHGHMDADFERFLVDAVRALTPDGARLWTLEADGQTLAICLNLVQGSREHGYLLGLGDGHAAFSPGTLLKRHALLEAIGEGRAELDLGPGRDESKYRLGGLDRELTRLVVVSPATRGRLIGMISTIDLRLRNTALAEAVRRRREGAPARGRDEPVRAPTR